MSQFKPEAGMSAACLLFIPLLAAAASAQQPPDIPAQPPIARPAYEQNAGPVIAIDEAHKNTHTYGQGSQGLVRLLQRDGYRVRPFVEAISRRSLEGIDVLVIAQPGMWDGPDASLNDAEVGALVEWVRAGGSLLLMLGHMPAPSSAAKLTAALGVRNWHDGYAMVQVSDSLVGRIIFSQRQHVREGEPDVIRTGPAGTRGVPSYQGADAVLSKHPIVEGRGPDESVRRVMTFVGSSFQAPDGAEALLVMPQRATSVMPENPDSSAAWRRAPRVPVGGWVQGAVMPFRKGRVALFGETALFSGQWPVHPAASENYKLILNVMHWLTRIQ